MSSNTGHKPEEGGEASKLLSQGEERSDSGELSTTVQPVKATEGLVAGMQSRGIWEIGGEGKLAGIMDGTAVEDKKGGSSGARTSGEEE